MRVHKTQKFMNPIPWPWIGVPTDNDPATQKIYLKKKKEIEKII